MSAAEQITYIVYTWRGEIKVKEGRMNYNGTFLPPKANSPWMSKCPREPMKINSYGKVWCKDKSQIPIAKEMVREHAIQRIESIENTYTSARRNIEKIIETEEL